MPSLAWACMPKFQARLTSTEKLCPRAVTLVITLPTACLLPSLLALFHILFILVLSNTHCYSFYTPDSLRITSVMAPKGDKLSWTMDHDIRLVKVLRNKRAAGHQAENGWKGVTWVAAEKEFEEDPPPKRTAMKCSAHWTHVCQFFFIASWAHSHVL